MSEPTFDDLMVEYASTRPEAERVRELCSLVCNAAARAFWSRGEYEKSDGASACARAIRCSDGVEALEATIRRIVGRAGDGQADRVCGGAATEP